MKKLLLLLISGFSLQMQSQATITLLDKETQAPMTNGTVIQVWGDVTEPLISWHGISAVNNTGSTTKINMKRYMLSSQSTVEDYFCWYVCLGSVESSTTPILNHSSGACFNSNDTDTLNYFSSYYKSMGLTGSATYRYVWFDAANLNDTAYIDVTFNVTPVSVNEINREASLLTYPNPANEILNLNLENIDYTSKVSAEVYDLIGNKVISQVITAANSRLDVADLSNGAYFCTIVSDRKTILIKRVIISH